MMPVYTVIERVLFLPDHSGKSFLLVQWSPAGKVIGEYYTKDAAEKSARWCIANPV